MNNKERSPFFPGYPVPHELFVGRKSLIGEILRSIKQSSRGKQQNLFLSGARGIGKSSLASFLRYYATSNMNMIGIHAFQGGIVDLREMVRDVFDQLLKVTKDQSWFSRISGLFGDYVKEVGLFNISVSFNPPRDRLRELSEKFPEALWSVLEQIKDYKQGLFIALDDINGLAEKQQFADWYKSFVDEIATHYDNFPVCVMLIGLPEKQSTLSNLQPSLMRIFRPVEIKNLSNEEVRSFLMRAFASVGMKVKAKAMEFMVRYSSGLPVLMHEIGDATFWKDDDNVIGIEDAVRGIVDASTKVGDKYLTPKFYKQIVSGRYRSILNKLGKVSFGAGLVYPFTIGDLRRLLDEPENKIIHHFLHRMIELGVLVRDPDLGKGCYRFVNEMYPVYIAMRQVRPGR